MKKISIAFLAAMSLAAFGCRKSKDDEAIAKLTELKNKMCACKDKACSEKVSGEYAKWEQGKSDGDKPGTPGEEDKKMEEVKEELTQCLLKLEFPGGSGATGSAAAAGAAGATGSAGGSGGTSAGGSGGTMGSESPAAGSAAGSAAAGSAH